MIEHVLDAVKAYLTAGITAELAAQNTAHGADSVTLADPAAIYIQEKRVEGIQAYPAIILVPRHTENVQYQQGQKDAQHEVAVYVALVGQVEETVAKQLYRYARAVEVLIEKTRGQGTAPYTITASEVTGIDYFVAEADAEWLRKAAVIEARLTERVASA